MTEELTLIKLKQKIFWADYYTEKHKFRNFNIRKHGVTIDNDFLSILANNQFLTAQHFVYFQSLLSYYYGQYQVLSLDCHFFSEFMPDITNSILPNMMITQLRQNSTQNDQNSFSNSEIYQEQQQYQDKQDQPESLSIYYKTFNFIKSLNPLRFFWKNKPKQEVDFQENQYKTSQDFVVSQQNQELLSKFNFQVKNITYLTTNSQEPAQVISKREMKINNVIFLENEKGKYQFNKLNILINDLKEKYKFSQNLQNNFFSLFKFTYIPINLQNNHWLCAIVEFEENKIQYLDSNYAKQDNIVEGLEQMLNYIGENTKWLIQQDSPKQENSFDCGIFCLMALYQLYKTGKFIQYNQYNQQDINSFRKQLLYLSIIESQIDINQKLLNSILDFQHKN